jgi:hypothetical protein
MEAVEREPVQIQCPAAGFILDSAALRAACRHARRFANYSNRTTDTSEKSVLLYRNADYFF